MRILVLEAAAREQHARLHEGIDDGLVGVALLALVVDDALAFEARRVLGEGAVLIDRVGDRGIDAARLQEPRRRRPDVEVFAAMAGRRVHEARARVVGDVVAVEERDAELVAAEVGIIERMQADHCINRLRWNRATLLECLDFGCLHDIASELVGEDILFANLRPVALRRCCHLIEAVLDLRVERDCSIAR